MIFQLALGITIDYGRLTISPTLFRGSETRKFERKFVLTNLYYILIENLLVDLGDQFALVVDLMMNMLNQW